MEIYATRSSVAAGDDIDAPHGRSFSMTDNSSVEDVLAHIQGAGYLPELASGNACWSATSNVPVAVLAQKWTEPKMVSHLPDKLDSVNGVLRIQFNYHGQVEPDMVHKFLREYRSKAV